MISLHEQRDSMREPDMALSFQGAHFPPEVILMGVRWYGAYPLSPRPVEALMEARGVEGEHSTINRGVITYRPPREEAFHRRKTYVTVKGEWRSLSRAVEQHGQPLDFLLTEPRDTDAARRGLKPAIRRHGLPESIPLDGSDAKAAAIKRDHEAHGTAIAIRQVKDCNNSVEQDHRGNSVRLNFCVAVELADASGPYGRSNQLPWPSH